MLMKNFVPFIQHYFIEIKKVFIKKILNKQKWKVKFVLNVVVKNLSPTFKIKTQNVCYAIANDV